MSLRSSAVVLVVTLAVAGVGWHRALAAAPKEQAAATAPASLMETGLYENGRPGIVDRRNQPFSPQYPLWTDGARKRRWIRLPEGTTIDASRTHEWDFPVGTKLWKEFAFGDRPVETRMLWKVAADEWVFASYAWNTEGTGARLVPATGLPGAAEIAPGRFHHIPSINECRACHVAKRTEVLGFNALQLSTDRDPAAIHGEPLAEGMATLATLVADGRLSPPRPDLVASPPRIAARSPEERAVLGYLAGNCGACHNRDSDLAPLGLHWKHGELATDAAGTLQAMLRRRTKWQVPGVPEGESRLIDTDHPEQSALVRRMSSRWMATQMPPLGTVVADRAALDHVRRWLAEQRPDRTRE